ncbi:glycogen/starch/alpha-glucan phosphorylase [Hornefia butyriciproducens]|uniref:Alpha-1,4 glucan phosphorylase n=1 Tax=Hornefia butyriciproducens TaxID=2652293 RepID=A0A6L5Y4L4_9FIRM|nr:glycogen/starch/alpha-glucan phosphorylase [Hornefia butyriciproducens]MST50717.1 glycogen/starch/alpha-glucan phosphorylase [Hornefia butyriciproducens]
MAEKKTTERKTAAKASRTGTAAKKAKSPKTDKTTRTGAAAKTAKTKAAKAKAAKAVKKVEEAVLEVREEAKLKDRLNTVLEYDLHTTPEEASAQQMYKALARVVNEQLRQRYIDFKKTKEKAEQRDDVKKVYYICMEYLMGQSLRNNLFNLGEMEEVREILEGSGLTLEEVFDCEPDAGLGNGGLGRLAACFLSTMTTDGYDATGFSLRYEYGLFKQKIVDGWQVELPDNWLPGGHVWLNENADDPFDVTFYGTYQEYWTEEGLKFNLENPQVVQAVPYDMYISGYETKTTNKLRLWKAVDSDGFDMATFNSGDFTRAAQKNNSAEVITKVLYPADNIEEGKELRLKQQYFMVSASCQNIVRDHYKIYGTLDNFHKKNVIHINDTHPALSIPELMRIFMDDYGCSWDYAWERVVNTVSYTNHTVLAEALEKWNDSLVRGLMPRIYVIIQEINRRFRDEMNQKFPGDWGKIDYISPLGDNQVRMANLAVLGSHRVNGVSALHSKILQDDLFHDFYLADPDKFTNVTNGIAYRRWLCQSNPGLAELLDETIGPDYRTDYHRLADFERFVRDETVLDRLEEIKHANKVRFADKVKSVQGVDLDPDSIFVVQAKRLHEYKRQLLNALRIISRYQALKADPNLDMRPETYLFAAKSAPNYYLAKSVIQLISKISEEIEQDPRIREKLKVVFLENYSVSMAEHLMPAADISEQISTAGKEASGTGNMKLMINGAVTIGTMDGANVEIYDAVGPENIFIFGKRVEEIRKILSEGYNSGAVYSNDPVLKAAVDRLSEGFAGMSFQNLKDYLLKPGYSIADPYMCLLDFADYCRVHDEMFAVYEDRRRWNSMSVVNIAKAYRFAADSSIQNYADQIWNTRPVLSI